MYNLLIYLVLILPTAVIASTCTEDYIISGGRKINLIPDLFQIKQMNSSLMIQRGDFTLIFIYMKEINEENLLIRRYSLDFIGNQYHFYLINSLDDNIKR